MSEYIECPYCAEQIRVEAVKCKHCKSLLEQTAPVAHPPLGETGAGKAEPPPLPTVFPQVGAAVRTAVPPPPFPQQSTPATPVKSIKPGYLAPTLVAVIILLLVVSVVIAFKNIDYFTARGEQPSTGDLPVAADRDREIEESPAVEDHKEAPDFNALENSVFVWLTANLIDGSFVLLHQDDVPDIDEYFEKYGEDESVIIYRVDSAGDSEVTILLGIPYSEAFTRLSLEWQDGTWVVTGEEDLW